MSVLLQVQGLGLRAGQRLLLSQLDLAVSPGQFWCLLGPNGVGKTWLLQALAGLRQPFAGQISVAGRPLGDWRLAELARWRGLVPQHFHDSFAAPVLEVVLQGRHPHLSRWHWEGAAEQEEARAALVRVGLAGFGERDVCSLSGGERQRVALAGLLMQDPPLALLDEPLAHLDLAQQIRVLDLLKHEVALRQRAVLMSVHDLSLAQRAASHVLLLPGDPALPVLAGPASEVMQEAHLSAAFGHPLRCHEAAGRRWWLPL